VLSVSTRKPRKCALLTLAALLAILAAAGCGGGDDSTDPAGEAPAASSFPPAQGAPLEDLLADAQKGDDLVVAPAGAVFDEGRNRFGFAVFTVDREQVTDADVAIYAAHGPAGKTEGPFPARVESLETEPAFTAQTTADDPDAAKAVYVTELDFDQPGEWRLVALVRRGDETSAVRIPSIVVHERDAIPAVGDPVPKIHTPTADEVGNIQEIDTRVPPDSLHGVDFADVVGHKPVVLLFATPALCTSRVCGPVVDVAEQVKRDVGDDVAFIHMEIWKDNDPNKGPREQVSAFHLQTEPWLFVLDRQGRVSTRIEGAFSVGELEHAVDRVTG
jgi:hypothetical protein